MPQILLCEAHPSEEQERADSKFGKHRNGSAAIAALLLATRMQYRKRIGVRECTALPLLGAYETAGLHASCFTSDSERR